MYSTLQVPTRLDQARGGLPLLELAERARIRALPWPARRLAHRHNLPASTARAVAEAAGLCMETP